MTEPLHLSAELPEAIANILIIDDRPDKQLALETVLEGLGQNIVKASSGSEALRLLLRQDFAVILLDVSMPDMDGFETAALIRQRPKTEHTPIIFVTSVNTNETHASRGYSLGAVDYIFSPIEPEILRAKVSVFLELFKKTEQVRRQSELLRLEAVKRAADVELRLQSLLNTLDVGVFRLSSNGALLEANPALLRLLGSTTFEEAKRFDFTPVVAILGKATRGELPAASQVRDGVTREGDVELVRADGTRVWVAVTLQKTAGGADGPIIEGVMDDVTERKRVEEKLKDADRLKDEFLAMLAHELRNPLAPIRNAVEVLKIGTADPARLPWAVGMIDRQVGHITRLVDDLLDVSRITRGKIKLHLEPVDLKKIVARVVETSTPLLELRKQMVQLDLQDVPMILHADETRIAQILSNLLNNASKYSAEGAAISISANVNGAAAIVTVTDYGIGIGNDMLLKIFDPFVQVERSLDRSQGGLGIGLTLVRKLVEMHDGTVIAESEGLGKGARLVVELPVVQEKAAVQVPSVRPAAPPDTLQSNLSILVVDDNIDSAESLALYFQLRGNSVQVAHSGQEALRLAQEDHLDLVFLDIGLPKMDGYEVARRLRPLSKNQNMRLVALTGYGQLDDKTRAEEAGFDLHFTKPINGEELERLIGEPAK